MKSPLCRVDEIPDQGAKKVDFFGREALVFKVEGVPRAVMNACLHIGGPLVCEGGKFICQWHGAEFDAADGRRIKGPARQDSRLMFIPTRVEDGVLMYVWGE